MDIKARISLVLLPVFLMLTGCGGGEDVVKPPIDEPPIDDPPIEVPSAIYAFVPSALSCEWGDVLTITCYSGVLDPLEYSWEATAGTIIGPTNGPTNGAAMLWQAPDRDCESEITVTVEGDGVSDSDTLRC